MYLQCKIWSIFNYCKAFLDTRIFFYNLFWVLVFSKMKLKNNLVGSFSSGIGLVIEFHLQSVNFIEILESF